MKIRSCALLNLRWVYELLLFITGKKYPIFLKCPITKFRFVIKTKVCIWHFLFDKIRHIGKDEFISILSYCNFKCRSVATGCSLLIDLCHVCFCGIIEWLYRLSPQIFQKEFSVYRFICVMIFWLTLCLLPCTCTNNKVVFKRYFEVIF